MKKVFLFSALIALISFSSCTNKQAESTEAESTEVVEPATEVSDVTEDSTVIESDEIIDETVEENQ